MSNTESYSIIAEIFPRLLGLIYFFAFGAFIFQIKALIGKNGILPLPRFLNYLKTFYPKKYYTNFPTIFWLNDSDQAIQAVVWTGTILSICLMVGVFPPLLLFLLFVLYLSIVNAGQDFLSFGWEGFLLDITINAFFMSWTQVPNLMIWININLLLLRFHYQGGLVKLLSGDVNWRNLTGVAFHYQTQPIPNAVAWYAYKLPMWFQQLSTFLMLFIEIIVSWGIFGTEEMRLGVFVCFVGLQYFIWLTGNFSFLNHLTVVFSTILLNNSTLSRFFSPPVISPVNPYIEIFLSFVGVILISLQILRLIQNFYSSPKINRIFTPLSAFHLSNRYGIFAVMTTHRYEIVVEGSHDGISWKEYLFKHKPSEVNRRPRRISPYQPRIDWQIWFLPFSTYVSTPWFQNFLTHLLLGTPEVLSLLRENPFPEAPPKLIRSIVYLYKFTTFEEKRKTGAWWKRELKGNYGPVVCLKENI